MATPASCSRQEAAQVSDGGFVAERQFYYEVMRLANKVRGNPARKRDVLQRLEDMVRAAQPSWLISGVTAAAIAEAYAELGRFADASKSYEQVLIASPATASLRSVEQLANLLARLAAEQDKPDLAVMSRSTRLLQSLAAIGENSERLSLIGATSKRRAIKSSGQARLAALEDMVDAYDRGYKLATTQKSDNPWYPLANLIAGRVAMGWQSKGTKTAPAIVADMKALRVLAKTVAAGPPISGSSACLLTCCFSRPRSRASSMLRRRKALDSEYRTAAQRAGTPREVASATGQIKFLRDMARSSSKAGIKKLANSLDKLVRALS